MQVSAFDNVGVTKVEFYLDNILQTTDITYPYLYSFDTHTTNNGPHTLLVKAYDAAGNTATASLSVTVSNIVVDTTPPSVSVTYPANGSTVSGYVNVQASASDNVNVTKVEFYVDNVLRSADTSVPYGWTNTNVSNGARTLLVKAYDAAGNIGTAMITVTVANVIADVTPPAIFISSPSNGAIVSGAISIDASASDNVAVTKVEFYIDSLLKVSDFSYPYAYTFNTTNLTNGQHTLQAKAYDAAENTVSNTITMVIANTVIDTIPPTVFILYPANGSTVSETISISTAVSDNVGVAKINFYIDNTLKYVDNSYPYSYSWNTLTTGNGRHSVKAIAYDAAGNYMQHMSMVTVSNAITIDGGSSTGESGSVNGTSRNNYFGEQDNENPVVVPANVTLSLLTTQTKSDKVNFSVIVKNTEEVPYLITVDYGDGKTETFNETIQANTTYIRTFAHQYSSAGRYIVKTSVASAGITVASQEKVLQMQQNRSEEANMLLVIVLILVIIVIFVVMIMRSLGSKDEF